MILPNENEVLAKIEKQGDLGLESWFEVVSYYDGKWRSYAGSDTFLKGERVVDWIYCQECFNESSCTNNDKQT